MDIEDFFNDLHKKSWKDNIDLDASIEFNKFLEYLQNNKDFIIEDVVKSIGKMQAIKLESLEEFTFSTYKKWMTKFMSNYMSEKIEEQCE